MAGISIGKLAIHLTTETAGMVAGFSKAKSLVNGFAGSMGGGGIGSALGGISMGAAAATTAIATATAALGAFAYKGIEFASSMEKAKASFTGFLGSASEADSLLGNLFQFAAATPFEFPEVRDAAKTMMAMGSAGEDVMGQMRMLGEVASGSGQPLGELANVFGQVMQAGRLTGNELRQFNERGIPVLTELANMLDVPKAKIRELVEAGEISSAQVVEAFSRMATGSGIFAGQMGRQSETLAGQWATFKDNMMMFAGAVMSYVIPTLTAMLRGFNQLFEMIRGVKKETTEETQNAIKEYAAKASAQQQVADAAKAAQEQAKAAAEEQKKQMDAMKSRADQLSKSLRNPAEVWRDSMNELNKLLENGLISWEIYTRGIEEATQALEKTTESKKTLEAVNKPIGGLVQGTAAARSAEFSAKNEFDRVMQAEAKKQTELARRGTQQREAILQAIRAGRPVDVREVNI